MCEEMETSMSEAMETEQCPVLHMKLLHRAHELPLVKSAATYVTTFYKQAKDYSPLVNSTLSMAVHGAKLAGIAATPVVTRFDDNIHKVDDIACEALDALETRYPSVRMDTEEVSACIVSAGSKVRDGAEKLAVTLLESTPGQLALMGLAEYLRIANEVANIALPADIPGSCSSKSFEYGNLAVLNVAVLSDKLYHRIYKQSTVQLQQLHEMSTVQLQRLQEMSTKALSGLESQLSALQLATKSSLERHGIKGPTEKLWQQVQFTTNNMYQQCLLAAGQVSSQLAAGSLEVAQLISSQLVSLYDTASSFATSLPGAVQNALQMSKSHADKLYLQLSQVKSTEEFTALALSEIKETMKLVQSSAAHLFETASNLPHLQHAPGVMYTVSERWQSCMEPVQEHETSDIKKLLFCMIVYNILYGFVLLYITCFAV